MKRELLEINDQIYEVMAKHNHINVLLKKDSKGNNKGYIYNSETKVMENWF